MELTMDAIIGEIASIPDNDAAREAVKILFALQETGARNTDEALDIVHDYNAQAKQHQKLFNKFLTAGNVHRENGIFLCPSCKRRVFVSYDFCSRCGKKLKW